MKSVVVLCAALGAVSNASECHADESSLLQSKKIVRKHEQEDSQAVLKHMRAVANSFLEGSDTTMTSDEVNDALEAASSALARLSPAIQQQIANIQQQVTDAASAVQVCHDQEQAVLRSGRWDHMQQRSAAVESCQQTLSQSRADEERQCGIAEDCLCDEARQRTTDQEALCASMLETYEAAFCEHHSVCTVFRQCHSSEAEVFARMRADAEAEMAIVVQEYIAIEQSQCITGLITQAMTPPLTPITHAALIACDDVDVSALRIDYPNLPAEPAACPAHEHGTPECVADEGPELFPGFGSPNVGACREADGEGHGQYSRADHATDAAQCASACDASPTCFAFEFTGVTSGNTGCELHREPMPEATGHRNGLCYNRPAGPPLAGYAPSNVGACREADGSHGQYSRADHATDVAQCANACDASATCVAFEFGGVTSGNTGCELHRRPMPNAEGGRNGLCYNKMVVAGEDTKCPFRNDDRLFRSPTSGDSDITLEQCYEECRGTAGCNHFSYGPRNGGFVCMGCTTLANAQSSTGFTAYDMPNL